MYIYTYIHIYIHVYTHIYVCISNMCTEKIQSHLMHQDSMRDNFDLELEYSEKKKLAFQKMCRFLIQPCKAIRHQVSCHFWCVPSHSR